jgi:hypothetical protein
MEKKSLVPDQRVAILTALTRPPPPPLKIATTYIAEYKVTVTTISKNVILQKGNGLRTGTLY